MDYELMVWTLACNEVGNVTRCSMVSVVNTFAIDDEQELIICEYSSDGKRLFAVADVVQGMGIDVLKNGINPESEIYYDTEQEEILTRNELFESWKEQLTEEDQTFKDFLINATQKDGTIERIY